MVNKSILKNGPTITIVKKITTIPTRKLIIKRAMVISILINQLVLNKSQAFLIESQNLTPFKTTKLIAYLIIKEMIIAKGRKTTQIRMLNNNVKLLPELMTTKSKGKRIINTKRVTKILETIFNPKTGRK